MRVAVIGGAGLVGAHTVRALRESGHEASVVSRSAGTDVLSGDGLDDALRGVDTVVDVLNSRVMVPAEAEEFFSTTSRHLLEAGERAGVTHHVTLSIVGLDRVEGNAHYAGKRAQEQVVANGRLPFTILRATQFHEFAGMVVGWTMHEGTAVVPPLLVQPVAAADVGDALAEVAAGVPHRRALELAGPEPQDLVDMARRTLAARGEAARLVPSWRDGPFGTEMAGEVLLPGSDARLAPTTFDAWLAGSSRGVRPIVAP